MRLLLPLGLLALSTPAAAQIPGTGVSIDAEAMILSDYRFRGVSRSGEDPALQAGLTVSAGDFYLGGRGTTLNDLDDYGNVQLDLYGGYSTQLSLGTSVDAGLRYYAFPGSEGDTGYFEPYASLSYQIGPLEATAGAQYAWSQEAIGDEDMLYLFAGAEAGIPLTGLTLTAQAGRQDWGRYGSYWNWSLGARHQFGPIEAGIRYVDTDLPSVKGQDAGLVVSAGLRF
ncbi:TorF family putative porin [Allosphingosinicella vermicomposti]|uniref:TorF family putative porin n=1 Tax=Allosphingosinicella vermicomposti TaxID=614671 RepID=UPI000D0EFC21|nr:TorF family putative porin [Allosphingosinicella vermicomposti]